MFVIKGKFKNKDWEKLDESNDHAFAEELAKEYKEEKGQSWLIKIEEQ